MIDVARLAAIAEQEFSDIVESTSIIRGKLRVILTDASFVDFDQRKSKGALLTSGNVAMWTAASSVMTICLTPRGRLSKLSPNISTTAIRVRSSKVFLLKTMRTLCANFLLTRAEN